jgi:hypothetical protein
MTVHRLYSLYCLFKVNGTEISSMLFTVPSTSGFYYRQRLEICTASAAKYEEELGFVYIISLFVKVTLFFLLLLFIHKQIIEMHQQEENLTENHTTTAMISVAEFIDPLRGLKLAQSQLKVGSNGGMTHTPFHFTLIWL